MCKVQTTLHNLTILHDRRGGPPADARDAAEDWLRDLLAGGPLLSDEIRARAQAAGLSWRTIHRAKDALKIVPVQDGTGRAWTWGLPAPAEPPGRSVPH